MYFFVVEIHSLACSTLSSGARVLLLGLHNGSCACITVNPVEGDTALESAVLSRHSVQTRHQSRGQAGKHTQVIAFPVQYEE